MEWQYTPPTPGEIRYWQHVLQHPWTPIGAGPPTYNLDRAYKIALWLKNNPTTLQNCTTRLRARGHLRYAYWDYLWSTRETLPRYIEQFDPKLIMFLSGAAVLVVAGFIVYLYQDTRQRQKTTFFEILNDLENAQADWPCEIFWEADDIDLIVHKDTPEALCQVKSGSGLGDSKGLRLYIPRHPQGPPHYLSFQTAFDFPSRRYLTLILGMRLLPHMLPRNWTASLTWYTDTSPYEASQRSFTFTFQREAKTAFYYVQDIFGKRLIEPFANPYPVQSFQYYIFSLDLQQNYLHSVYVPTHFRDNLQIPLQTAPATEVRLPQLWFNMTSDFDSDARIDIDRILIANHGATLHYTTFQPPDVQLDPKAIQKEPYLIEDKTWGYKHFPSVQVPGQPQPWDAYKPPWMK